MKKETNLKSQTSNINKATGTNTTAKAPFDFGDLAPEGIVYYKINRQNLNGKFGFI